MPSKGRPQAALVNFGASVCRRLWSRTENGPQSLIGGAAVPMAVLSDGEFSKSKMSSSVLANRSRRVRCGRSSLRLLNGTMKRFSISASTEV